MWKPGQLSFGSVMDRLTYWASVFWYENGSRGLTWPTARQTAGMRPD